ncbi:cryptochrome/photolyase family protein [Variovorax sp. VNK109]|uniref:cryptochrome/photolyase family protein n=1 Tax=Variovorax sp. VNK109 TaxID=3400919 RepID=UPI003C10D8C1
MSELRSLIIVLGDQLDPEAAAFDGFDASKDAVWMAEVEEESTHVWSGKPRIVLFLSAMRHFAASLASADKTLIYRALGDEGNLGSLGAQLAADIEMLQPRALRMTQPGDWRVLQSIRDVAAAADVPLTVLEDRHFFVGIDEFREYARSRKSLRMEYFYRAQRTRHRVLMAEDAAGDDAQPEGGRWNFDDENRASFGAAGPGFVAGRFECGPDDVTREVISQVEARFADHRGSLDSFHWPVTREDALRSLHAFIDERLAMFGPYQDAMWPDEPWLHHSHLSAALNLKLLNPREVVDAAQKAYREGVVPLASAEGFIRQILGWREYVRGIYWSEMPGYLELNALDAQEPLPPWYWTGDVPMACLRDALKQTLTHGYANHIQRLMVTGLYALLLGVRPQAVHEWYLAVYVDAVEWVELPNTLGMSQYGDGGWMASKPYVATGRYIQKMSPYCAGCRFDPALRTGPDACPFTTLYWDFLMRHEQRLKGNPRMSLQLRNLDRIDAKEKARIRQQAAALRDEARA